MNYPRIKHPTGEDWTAAWAEPTAERRRKALQRLDELAHASRLPPWKAWLYLNRHVFGMALLAVLAGLVAMANGWAGLFVLAVFVLPLLGLRT